MNLSDLKKELLVKWRVQSFSKRKPVAVCVSYIDARQVQDLLDEVVGAENWETDYKEIRGHLYCGIGIEVEAGKVKWKWDCGSESNMEPGKGEASDSFKRAAVQWGVGRFLYSMNAVYLTANEVKTDNNFPYVVNNRGERVYDLTEYINNEEYKSPTTQKFNKESNDNKKQFILILKLHKNLFSQTEYDRQFNAAGGNGITDKAISMLEQTVKKRKIAYFKKLIPVVCEKLDVPKPYIQNIISKYEKRFTFNFDSDFEWVEDHIVEKQKKQEAWH